MTLADAMLALHRGAALVHDRASNVWRVVGRDDTLSPADADWLLHQSPLNLQPSGDQLPFLPAEFSQTWVAAAPKRTRTRKPRGPAAAKGATAAATPDQTPGAIR